MASSEAAWDLDHTKLGPNTIARFMAVILFTAECSKTWQEINTLEKLCHDFLASLEKA